MDFDPVHQIQQEEDQPQQQQPDVELAAQACAACKKQKRKCDKILPSCSLCIRIGRPCDYTTDTLPPPTPETFAALQQQVSNLEQLLRSSANANGSFSPAPANGQNSSNGSLSLSDGQTPPGNSLLTPSSSPLWSAPNSFPSLYFLDSNAFMYEKYQVRLRQSESAAPLRLIPSRYKHRMSASLLALSQRWATLKTSAA